jgi:tRNA (guanine-N7-)-methyltransferase
MKEILGSKPLRKIRSFVRREGRLTKGQQRALEELFPIYGLTPTLNDGLDFARVFGNTNPVHLEIGIGNGQTLVSMASAHPQYNYLGIEVHRPGVGNALLQIEKNGLNNIRLICDDAVEVLKNNIPDQSLSAVYIFFPDPWHKKRHNKRRLVQVDFINLLKTKLQPGGRLHMATDWEDYAHHMMKVMNDVDGFTNQAGADQFSVKPDYRPLTKFEQRGLRLGHGVWDLVFIRQ